MVLQDYFQRQSYDSGDISIDTLSFTFDLGALTDLSPINWQLVASGLESPESNDNFFFWAAFQSLIATIFGPHSIRLTEKFGSGRNFFRNSIQLENKAGFVAFGGNNRVVNSQGVTETRHERIQVYLSGEGCRQVVNWKQVYHALSVVMADYNPRITRVDIAYDDIVGKRSLQSARDQYYHGDFKGRGLPPGANFIDDMGSGKGSTLNIGSRDTGKMLRIYEKGKQLGDKTSPWTRWELEINSKQYDVPLEVLISPKEYISGAYQALEWISSARQGIKSKKKRESIEYSHLVLHGRRAYGSLVNYMMINRGMTPDQIVSELIRTGVPGRMSWTVPEHHESAEIIQSQVTHPHLYKEIHTVERPIPPYEHIGRSGSLRLDWVQEQIKQRSNA
ncbi:MAG: replication initiation factor domain-containing protein [Marinobacter sp.]|uniref:replication initiation factor domain-containing protein n=1 Tax=Marinobacter sp. TaxID=50741 RepID=UPI0034A01C4A